MAVPNFCAQPSLRSAKWRIQNPPEVHGNKVIEPKPYEHHVGSWAFTMISSVFHGPFWIITAEKTDTTSKKRPDIVVEEAYDDEKKEPGPYLFMELKSRTGDRLEEALNQVVEEIAETMESSIEAYVVVQRGTKIAFFEYHNDISNLDDEGIPHFRGCISLTQSYNIQGKEKAVLNNKPNDLENLYQNYDRLRKKTDLRDEAKEYEEPCVFDIGKPEHEDYINLLFHHMANKEPRSSV